MEDTNGDNLQSLLDILTQGEEQMRQLDSHLSELTPSELSKCLAQQVQCTFKHAISMAKAMEAGTSGYRGTEQAASDSPRSAEESTARISLELEQHRDLSKKRKGLPRWTRQVRMSAANLEGTSDDGYSWRKYGQKDILGAKFPRAYYRCTHRHTQACPATKYVQRSDSDLSVFDIIYQGVHTCQQARQATKAHPATTESSNPHYDHNQYLLSFKTGLKVETGSFCQDHEQEPTPSSSFSFPNNLLPTLTPETATSLSQSFVPPVTSVLSNFFSMSQGLPTGSYGGVGMALHGSESEFTEVFSAATTTTMETPMVGFDVASYQPGFDPNLSFDPSNHFRYN